MPSLLLYGGNLFLVRDGGLLTCLNAADGATRYQERLGAPGQYCASPVAADDRLYLTSVTGMVTVVNARGGSLEVLARNALGAEVHATPAIAGDTLYVRTAVELLAFAEPHRIR